MTITSKLRPLKAEIYVLITIILLSQSVISQIEIPLYEGIPLGSENWNKKETVSEKNKSSSKFIYNVVQPTLTAYLPPYYLTTGTAVIIAPGGDFHVLKTESEGSDLAEWLKSKGIAAFVLKYRLIQSETNDPEAEFSQSKNVKGDITKVSALATADGQVAVQYIRQNAKEYDIDPNKIGMIGFSAGGTVALNVAYNSNIESRPNFIAPIYASDDGILNEKNPDYEIPAFVVVASNDQMNIVQHSLDIYRRWKEEGHAAELHIYQKGGHGFGMQTNNLPTDKWYERFREWLHLQGYLKKLYPNKYEKLYGQDAVEQGKKDKVFQMLNDYAQLVKYRSVNELVSQKNHIENKVVFLGNSITEGWFKADKRFFTDNNFIGRGISGQTSSQLLLRFRQDVIDVSPTAVVIHIGTNDIAENTGPYDENYTMGNIKSMVELARVNNIEVILTSVLPSIKFEWNRKLGNRSDMILNLNERIKKYALEEKITYVDYHSAMKNDNNGMNSQFSEDGVHPTPKGFEIMKSLLLPSLLKLHRN